jgi:hypothetical protein
MKSLKQQRKQFAVVGRELREGRTEDVREHYQWLLVRSGCKTHRNDRLRSLCSELIVHGHYAKPAGFSPGVIGSYRTLRHGVMSHMFQVWKALPGRDAKPNGMDGYEFRTLQWKHFCSEFGYDPTRTLFVR